MDRPGTVMRPPILAVALLGLLLAGPPPATEAEERGVEAHLEALGKLTAVEGDSVGFSGVESPFFRIYVALVAKKVEGLPEKLLASERPVFRSMGLVLLVARDGREAVPTLRDRIADRGPIEYRPAGCVLDIATVGTVARGLLENRNLIADYGDWKPLLDEEALIRLDVSILARDDTAMLHEEAHDALDQPLWEGKLELDLAPLVKRFPGTEPDRIVKALGRAREDTNLPDLDAWLQKLLGDASQPAEARLAAASALTRVGLLEDVKASREALEGARSFLRKHDAEGLFADFDAAREISGKRKEAAAFAEGHPAAIRQINFAFYRPFAAGGDGEVPDRAVDALVRAAARLAERTRSWDTWGDAPFRVEWMLRFYGERLKERLGAERWDAVSRQVERAIAR